MQASTTVVFTYPVDCCKSSVSSLSSSLQNHNKYNAPDTPRQTSPKAPTL